MESAQSMLHPPGLHQTRSRKIPDLCRQDEAIQPGLDKLQSLSCLERAWSGDFRWRTASSKDPGGSQGAANLPLPVPLVSQLMPGHGAGVANTPVGVQELVCTRTRSRGLQGVVTPVCSSTAVPCCLAPSYSKPPLSCRRTSAFPGKALARAQSIAPRLARFWEAAAAARRRGGGPGCWKRWAFNRSCRGHTHE